VEAKLAGTCRLIQQFIENGEFDGAGLAVWVRGEPAVEWYAGMAGPDVPASANTLWPLASISKLYTATAVMSLVEEGKLTLSLRLADFIPEFNTEQRSQTRLWHLLTHTSGLIYESPEMERLLAEQTPLPEILKEAFSFSLLAAPGCRFEYSDYGIALAGRIAELVSGQSLPDLLRERVLEPAKLTETYFPPPREVYERLARVRDVPAAGSDGEMYNSDYSCQLAHPSFGVVASVRDLLKFGLLFHPSVDHRILSGATVRSMTRDQLNGGLTGGLVGVEVNQPQPWGLGFMVRGQSLQLGFGELASPAAFGHPGATGCVLMVDPEQDIALAFVSNRHAASGFERFLFREAAITNSVLASLT
jgi:serine-type D-Ala-D-Ala carboxypeptidase